MAYVTGKRRLAPLILVALVLMASTVRADVVTDWNTFAVHLTLVEKIPTPPANRMMAIVQSSVYEAVDAISKRYPTRHTDFEAPVGASIDAAIASANHVTLTQLLSSAKTSIDSAYQAALTMVPEGQAKIDGIAVGEKAAMAILTMCANDGASNREDYRPSTVAGSYVPTTVPVTPQWPQRKPWIMNSADEFRPAPPPTLNSELWARDYNESKAMGSLNGSKRTEEQTGIAQFWEATGPVMYFPVIRSVANIPGRDITRNARLLAVAAEAMDDAIVSVFDAKYHFGFWRPITAIRNGDIDGNDATERDASWLPFIETPMHPEYPCAHWHRGEYRCGRVGSGGWRGADAGVEHRQPDSTWSGPSLDAAG